MGVATRVTKRVVATTPLTVTLSLASKPYPNWYTPLERYISYGVDRAERAVEGIGRLEHRMDKFAHMQTEMQAPIDSQTSMIHDLLGHCGINPDA
jgi:hypothetical protein